MDDITVLYTGPIVTRKSAKDLGSNKYFHGKPCRHGHISERYTRDSACIQCKKNSRQEYLRKNPFVNYNNVKAWRYKNPDKVSEQNKRYEEKHPETHKKAIKLYRERHAERIRPIDAERARNRRKSNPEAEKRIRLKFKQNRELKLSEVAGRPRPTNCEVCDKIEIIVFDHCHNSGEFRGWICDTCNKVLGMVKDNPVTLIRLAKYLEDFNCQNSQQNKENHCQIVHSVDLTDLIL